MADDRDTESSQCTGLEQERDALLFMLEDLERSRGQLKKAHDEWIAALDAIHDPVFMHDRDCRIMRSNRAYAERAGMTVKEVLGKPYWEVFPKREGPLPSCLKTLEAAAGRDAGTESEEEVRLDSGEIFLSRAFSVRDENGEYLYSLHIMEDVTRHRQFEDRLRASEANYRLLFESSRDGLTTVGAPDWKFTNANAAALELFGVASEAEFTQLGPWDVSPERQPDGKLSVDKVREVVDEAIRKGSLLFEWMHRRVDGTEFPAEIHLTRVEREGEVFIQASTRDITERKRNERHLNKLNRTLQVLSACNKTLIHAQSEPQLLREMCRVIVEIGGYHAAWVGYAEHDVGKTILPMAQRGFAEGYLESLSFSWRDDECGRMPSARAVRCGKAQISQDIERDSSFTAWREQAREAGIASCIALPLKNSAGEVFGNLSIYAKEVDAFGQEELELLQEMAEDLAFGIFTLRVREERKQSAALLSKGLEDTVQVIATMVEMRDPYTNGHQQRVADLATAIATEMGLPEEQVRGIHLAGVIHDLGKIQTPAEILSKPGRLSEAEFALIKSHPQTGYDVLKDINFTWPIAQIVLQHHERLDGSGYPNGLKGDQIMLEARILIVADVVEAMSSHRPYRPGLGLSRALEEIRKNRGKFYDPDVVDACLKLFEEQRYQPPAAWATQ